VQETFLIGYDEVVQRKDEPGIVLLDTRPPAWYEGQGPWPRPGHIPGAVNFPAALLLDPDNLTLHKPVGEIEEILARAGILPDKTIICSCGTGRTATLVFLILKFLLGYPDVVIFEGGFTEWISHPDNPVVTGKNPR
jgi:thiosulfate/3-mercaptopyruvate sulfurtransferase